MVPALDINGEILIESLPIIEYLEETIPIRPILPKDPFKRARIRAFCEIINAGTQPLQNLRVGQKVQDDYNGNKEDWTIFWAGKGLNCKFYVLKNKI